MSIPPEIRKYAKAMQKDGYRGPLSWASKIIDWVVSAPLEPAPIDMILYCPNCGVQHIDGYEAAPGHFSPSKDWTNPPHRSHLCHNPDCRTIWRPADVPTNGVLGIKTEGKADTWVVYPEEIDAATAAKHPDSVLGLALEALQKERQRSRDVSMLTVRAIEEIQEWCRKHRGV